MDGHNQTQFDMLNLNSSTFKKLEKLSPTESELPQKKEKN